MSIALPAAGLTDSKGRPARSTSRPLALSVTSMHAVAGASDRGGKNKASREVRRMYVAEMSIAPFQRAGDGEHPVSLRGKTGSVRYESWSLALLQSLAESTLSRHRQLQASAWIAHCTARTPKH